ncbi:MAG: hypothetical protein AAF633_05710 [Chloroflexota bacterium]
MIRAVKRAFCFELVPILAIVIMLGASTLSAQEDPDPEPQVMPLADIVNQPVVKTETGEYGPGFLIEEFIDEGLKPPLQAFNMLQTTDLQATVPTANIVVTYSGSWPTEAQAAFEHALSIWERYVVSGPVINVQATWGPINSGSIGTAGAVNINANFNGAPQPNTWYSAALANALADEDLIPSNPEIAATFNSNFANSFYDGLDGNPAFNQIDFVTLVLHEVGHGLGFSGSISGNSINQTATWGSGSTGYPQIYDLFTENNAGQSILSFTSGSGALYNQVTTPPIFFDSPLATAENGGRSPLYVENPWVQGRSYSHLDQSTFSGTQNRLMTPFLVVGTAIHEPGLLTLAMFADMGWTVNTSPLILGDVTCDAAVNTADPLSVLQFNIGQRSSVSSCPLNASSEILDLACDVNGDQVCNTTDALFILQCNVDLSNAFCVANQ